MVKQLLTSSIQTSERATNCHLNVHTALFSCQRVSEHIAVIEDDIWRDRSKNKRIWEVKTCQILFPREDSLKLMEKKRHLWQVFITCFSSLPSFNCFFFWVFWIWSWQRRTKSFPFKYLVHSLLQYVYANTWWEGAGSSVGGTSGYILPDCKNYPDGFVDTFFFNLLARPCSRAVDSMHKYTGYWLNT